MDTKGLIGKLHQHNFVLLDCEGIQASKTHCCVRKLYMLAKDGMTDAELEFIPCKRFKDLEKRYNSSFWYCYYKIHNLCYYPVNTKLKCCDVAAVVNRFVKTVNASLVLYKGGHLEKNVCDQLGIACLNIELLGAQKVNSHSPKEEVNEHYKYLLNAGCVFQLPVRSI